MTFIAGESSSCDVKRAKSAAEMVGTGTPAVTASCTVHRPSPLSAAKGRMPSRSGRALRRVDEQVEQPRPDHRSIPPAVEGGQDIDVELGLGHQLVPLGVGLHEGVLDAVVDHLREVS